MASSKHSKAALMRQSKAELARQVMDLQQRLEDLEAGPVISPSDLATSLIDAIQHLSEAFVTFDAEGRLVVCNKKYRDIYNYTEDQAAPGVKYEDLVQLDIDQGTITTEGSDGEEYTNLRSKQRERLDGFITIHLTDGRTIRILERPTSTGGIVSIQKDITTEVEENKIGRQLRQAIEMLPHPVIIYDLDDHLVFFNRAYSEFFSYMPPFEEVAGKYFFDFIQYSIDEPGVVVDPLLHEDPEAYRTKRLHRLHNPPQGPFEQHTSGRWQLVSEHRIEDLGFFSIRQDITDRVEAEQAVAVAKEEAETANQAKSDFLAAMSHEIRTPMNGILAMLELLRETILDSEQFHMTEIVRDSALSLLYIIDDILDFSKIEAGKLKMEKIPFSIRDTVEKTAMNLHPNTVKKGIRLEIYIDPKIPEWVIGDSGRVRQILINLAGNAIKFTENEPDLQGLVIIRAELTSLGSKAEDKARVRFAVQDTGIGINEDTQAELFEPFVQVERSTTRRYGGSGLGLSICKNLTGMMDGEISVQSELGKGSTFIVDLPFEIDRATPARDDEPDLSDLRCLIVTPPGERSDIIRHYLQFKECAVTQEDDLKKIEEVIQVAAQGGQAIDIVVIGSTWPIIDQDRVIKSIRDNPGIENIHFLVLTREQLAKHGMIEPDMVVVADLPLRRSSFLFATAMAAGRVSPVFFEGGETHTGENVLARESMILVAEDNVTNQEVILQQLKKLGYPAVVAEDGRKALEAWNKGDYALLLTDCHMPDMDGYELTIAIRRAEGGSGRHLPIIALTADVFQDKGERCLAVGMDGFLLKPVELNKLGRMLSKWLPDATEMEFVGKDHSEEDQASRVQSGPVDPSILNKIVGDDLNMHRIILGKFVDPAKDTAAQILEAFDERSAITIGGLAHSLKSSARAIGANDLADICLALETAGKSGDWKTIDELVPSLGGSVQVVGDYIGDILGVKTGGADSSGSKDRAMTQEDIGKLKVLVVDDEIFMRDLILTTLEALGVKDVQTVGDGRSALKRLGDGKTGYDLILCDLYMPDMDGIEFLDHAKEGGYDGNVVLFSGVNREMLEKARRLATAKQIKILGCLEKPITQEDLKNLLTRGESKRAV